MDRNTIQTLPMGRARIRAIVGRNVAAALVLMSMAGTGSAATDDDVRATFDRFVAAQNAHDVGALKSLLTGSPDFLWITRGAPVWGTEAALERFTSLYKGTWRLDPDVSDLKVILIDKGVAQIFVPIDFTIGAPGEQPKPMRFLMNMILAETADGWTISSILPIPAPVQ